MRSFIRSIRSLVRSFTYSRTHSLAHSTYAHCSGLSTQRQRRSPGGEAARVGDTHLDARIKGVHNLPWPRTNLHRRWVRTIHGVSEHKTGWRFKWSGQKIIQSPYVSSLQVHGLLRAIFLDCVFFFDIFFFIPWSHSTPPHRLGPRPRQRPQPRAPQSTATAAAAATS